MRKHNAKYSILMCKKIYGDFKIQCPGKGRYAMEVEAATSIIDLIGEEEFIQSYLLNPNLIIEKLKLLTNNNGENLYEFILSFEDKDMRDSDVQKQYFTEINNFKISDITLLN